MRIQIIYYFTLLQPTLTVSLSEVCPCSFPIWTVSCHIASTTIDDNETSSLLHSTLPSSLLQRHHTFHRLSNYSKNTIMDHPMITMSKDPVSEEPEDKPIGEHPQADEIRRQVSFSSLQHILPRY